MPEIWLARESAHVKTHLHGRKRGSPSRGGPSHSFSGIITSDEQETLGPDHGLHGIDPLKDGLTRQTSGRPFR